MTVAADVRGKIFCVGQTVGKAVSLNRGGSCAVTICEVTRIDDGKVYLDGSKVAVKFPERLAIIC